jgi:DNA-binding NarL/FixJ family response regulator
MDIELPGEDGVSATRRLKMEMPAVTVVMLTVHDDSQTLFEAIKAGAQGYLVKNMRSRELLEQLQGLARAMCLLVENGADRDAPAYVTIAGELEDRITKLREHWDEMWELALAIEQGDA